jgi:hypothetical protein
LNHNTTTSILDALTLGRVGRLVVLQKKLVKFVITLFEQKQNFCL